jgi:hypothetical protein
LFLDQIENRSLFHNQIGRKLPWTANRNPSFLVTHLLRTSVRVVDKVVETKVILEKKTEIQLSVVPQPHGLQDLRVKPVVDTKGTVDQDKAADTKEIVDQDKVAQVDTREIVDQDKVARVDTRGIVDQDKVARVDTKGIVDQDKVARVDTREIVDQDRVVPVVTKETVVQDQLAKVGQEAEDLQGMLRLVHPVDSQVLVAQVAPKRESLIKKKVEGKKTKILSFSNNPFANKRHRRLLLPLFQKKSQF